MSGDVGLRHHHRCLVDDRDVRHDPDAAGGRHAGGPDGVVRPGFNATGGAGRRWVGGVREGEKAWGWVGRPIGKDIKHSQSTKCGGDQRVSGH